MRRPQIASLAPSCFSLIAAAALAQSPATSARHVPEAGRVFARPAQTFRGWGMSLAWEANDLYGGGRQPARIKDPKLQSNYMDLLYGDPASRLTLGFSIVRYNIGGGDDPTHTHMRPDAQMEGYQSGPDTRLDWTRDASQRRMLQEARKRGANIFEAASYSPPYWMTVSGCSSGGKEANQDNLRPEMREGFVNYLATVVKHFHDAEGIAFESLEPFNEPEGGWRAGGRQEGYAVPVTTQNAVIPMLASRLKRDGLSTFVAGVDTNNIYSAVGTANRLGTEALTALGRLNTHDYHSQAVGDPAKLREYKAIGARLHKPIWMSELGCCFANQGDKTDMWGALFIADSIRMDLRDMGAQAWVLWQPDWQVIDFDPHSGPPQLKKQYYAIAQYSRFIRAGFAIISAGGAYHTLAAYSRASKRLVLVTTNWNTPTSIDLDLRAFTHLPSAVTVYRTTSDEGVNLHEERMPLAVNGHLVAPLAVRSISTYVVDGVTPSPHATADAIEGTHKIVSQAADLCMNIATNSTNSGAAVIPYSCGAYINEEFDIVNRGDGLYSIHTVNALEGLCLNVATGAATPGDGKTPGAPGNLIQWSCGAASLPANELFQIQPAGAEHYRIRAQNSGLCLEDPGRGATIRQNHCNPAARSQLFALTD